MSYRESEYLQQSLQKTYPDQLKLGIFSIWDYGLVEDMYYQYKRLYLSFSSQVRAQEVTTEYRTQYPPIIKVVAYKKPSQQRLSSSDKVKEVK